MVDHAPALRHAGATPARGPGLAKGRRAFRSKMARRRLRVVPWQGDDHIALVGPAAAGRSPSADQLRQCLRALDERSVHHAVTPALTPYEAEPFFQAGFRLYERLHLLSCPVGMAIDIDRDPPTGAGTSTGNHPGEIRLAPGRPWHRNDVLAVDARAFHGFWRFDKMALGEARTATPSCRYRVAKLGGGPGGVGGRIVGYAVTGRAGTRGYLQRLAVDPDLQGRGIGRLLVNDSFRWLRQRNASISLVNTQESNETALGLYERVGFRRQTDGLLVLRWEKTT